MTQVAVHELGRSAQCSTIDVAGDALHVLGIFVTSWRCHLEQDRELSWHHQVARRGGCEHEPHRSPCWNANCCANAPPHDRPSTCALSRASVDGRYGSQGDGEPPTPGTSKMIASGPSSASRNGSTNSMFAPIPLKTSRGGRVFSPRR